METAQIIINVCVFLHMIDTSLRFNKLKKDVAYWKTATLNLQVKLATKEQLDKLINALAEEPPTHPTKDETP